MLPKGANTLDRNSVAVGGSVQQGADHAVLDYLSFHEGQLSAPGADWR